MSNKKTTQENASAYAEGKNRAVNAAQNIVGENLNFEGTEAFNLLRTNVFFSFSGDRRCRIVAITSPSPGTGKTLIAANLAYSIAKSGAKVLLIDGDLRLPTVAEKIGLAQKPGLSNLLTSNEEYGQIVQKYNGLLDVLTAGDIPPRPSELLGSAKMGELLETFKQDYEYVVIDLPPVTVVPDALAIAKYLDGILLAVRREHDVKPLVDEALRQLEISHANVLGFVFNDGKNTGKEYAKYKHYGGKRN